MKIKFYLLVVLFLAVSMLSSTNAHAEIGRGKFETTCCAPENLNFVSVNGSIFCVEWNIPSGPGCETPLAFEVQWKLKTGTIWKSKIVPYVSGSVISFCDTTDGCGTQQWAVRTICSGYTYSDWVYGNKFDMNCESGIVSSAKNIFNSSKPVKDNVAYITRAIDLNRVQLEMLDIVSKSYYRKKILHFQNEG